MFASMMVVVVDILSNVPMISNFTNNFVHLGKKLSVGGPFVFPGENDRGYALYFFRGIWPIAGWYSRQQ